MHIVKLRALYGIKPVKRDQPHEPAVYIRTAKAKPPNLIDRVLAEVLPEIVTNYMQTTQLIQVLADAGWRTEMKSASFGHS